MFRSKRPRKSKNRRHQDKLPAEFSDVDYMSIRHVALAVEDPNICAQFCVECLGMSHSAQTHDFEHSGMRWVEGCSKKHPFKLHFIPNSTQENCYVDVLNRMRMLINGNLDAWTQLMDNHICIGYHAAGHLVQKIVHNKISDNLKQWYKDNIEGNSGCVPFVGPVHRKDDVYQFYVMMPFGTIVEIQQPKKSFSSRQGMPDATTWDKLRPAFIQGDLANIAAKNVVANVQPFSKSTKFTFTIQK